MKKTDSLFCILMKSKKIAMTFGFLFFFFTSMAAVKTTMASGSWFDAANWSPAGVPFNEDTVMVNHNMTASGDVVEFYASWLIIGNGKSIACDSLFVLHGNMRLYGELEAQMYLDGGSDSTLIFGTLIAGSYETGNLVTINNGTIESGYVVIGFQFHNYGLIDADGLIAGAGGPEFVNHSSAAIVVSDTTLFSTMVLNEVNATMVLNELLTDGDLINDGDITITNWMHLFGIATGTGGRFCISDCFQNFSDITGDIDICDATPGDATCDWEFGTIAGTVTYCGSGSCKNNLGAEEESYTTVSVYPNPGYDRINIANAVVGAGYQLVNTQGKVVIEGIVSNEIFQLDLIDVERGVYFLQIQNGEQLSVMKFVRN